MEKITQFADLIGIKCNDISLLATALTHRSYINENRGAGLSHNERLEFLGDAVLELVVSEYLYQNYPEKQEGELTSFRAATVKTDTLASISKRLNVGEYLQMSKGEEATGGREKEYLLANAFEAILGSIYLDQGYEACRVFIARELIPVLGKIVEERLDIDAKTKFQEVAQRIYRLTPTYSLIQEEGPDHNKVFTMAVMVGDQEFGRGEGASKQRAEESAAREALKSLEKEHPEVKIA